MAHPASTGAATRSLHKSTWLTDDEPAPAGRGKDERRTCQHHQDSGRIIKTFEQIIKSSFRVMDLAMPLHPVDGQAGQDDGWPDCILTSRPIPGAWRPSVAADPNLSAILSASSYPFPTPGRRQRPNASMPGSRAALYGGLHMEAAVPWEEPAAAAAGYDAATSESDSAERSTPDAVVEAPKAKRRRKSRAQGSAEVMDKSSTSEKKVGRPRKAVDTSDCDDPEEVSIATRTPFPPCCCDYVMGLELTQACDAIAETTTTNSSRPAGLPVAQGVAHLVPRGARITARDLRG